MYSETTEAGSNGGRGQEPMLYRAPTREKGSRYAGHERGQALAGEGPSTREKGSRYPVIF